MIMTSNFNKQQNKAIRMIKETKIIVGKTI